MKILIIVGFLIAIAVIYYSCTYRDNKSQDSSHPPENDNPLTTKSNDKLILVGNVTESDIKNALIKFCNIYNKDKYVALPRLIPLDNRSFAITFPCDIDFATFCFAVNFIKYPVDIKYYAHVTAWTTTKQGDDWITDKSANKQVMLFLADNDQEYDNVFMTTIDGIGYKLGFTMGEENQLLASPNKQYTPPSVDQKSLVNLKFEDFR